jgi:DNA invertase Pin-like site-specific DNA recombinase
MIRIYRRVSTDRQGFDAQNHGLDSYLQTHNITSDMYTSYEELGLSGTRADRPEYQRLLGEVREGDTILVYEFSRLWRDMEEQSRVTKIFLALSVTVTSVTEGSVVTEEDVLRSDIMGVINQHEARRVKRRSREGIKAKQERIAKGLDVWNPRGPDKKKRSTEGYQREQARRRALKALTH